MGGKRKIDFCSLETGRERKEGIGVERKKEKRRTEFNFTSQLTKPVFLYPFLVNSKLCLTCYSNSEIRGIYFKYIDLGRRVLETLPGT